MSSATLLLTAGLGVAVAAQDPAGTRNIAQRQTRIREPRERIQGDQIQVDRTAGRRPGRSRSRRPRRSGDLLAAPASGGVWKSTDGGASWKPIFDDQPIASIGSHCRSPPSNPSVVYVGSGEANIRGNVAAGNGIYKTSDGGKTWTHVWNHEGQIGEMVVHPTIPTSRSPPCSAMRLGPTPSVASIGRRTAENLAAGAQEGREHRRV